MIIGIIIYILISMAFASSVKPDDFSEFMLLTFFTSISIGGIFAIVVIVGLAVSSLIML